MWAWEIKRKSWETARGGQRPISKATLSLGTMMQVSWPPMDKPSIWYSPMFKPFDFFEQDSVECSVTCSISNDWRWKWIGVEKNREMAVCSGALMRRNIRCRWVAVLPRRLASPQMVLTDDKTVRFPRILIICLLFYLFIYLYERLTS